MCAWDEQSVYETASTAGAGPSCRTSSRSGASTSPRRAPTRSSRWATAARAHRAGRARAARARRAPGGRAAHRGRGQEGVRGRGRDAAGHGDAHLIEPRRTTMRLTRAGHAVGSRARPSGGTVAAGRTPIRCRRAPSTWRRPAAASPPTTRPRPSSSTRPTSRGCQRPSCAGRGCTARTTR